MASYVTVPAPKVKMDTGSAGKMVTLNTAHNREKLTEEIIVPVHVKEMAQGTFGVIKVDQVGTTAHLQTKLFDIGQNIQEVLQSITYFVNPIALMKEQTTTGVQLTHGIGTFAHQIIRLSQENHALPAVTCLIIPVKMISNMLLILNATLKKRQHRRNASSHTKTILSQCHKIRNASKPAAKMVHAIMITVP